MRLDVLLKQRFSSRFVAENVDTAYHFIVLPLCP